MNVLTLITFFMTVFSDPGYVPLPSDAINRFVSVPLADSSLKKKHDLELTYEECLLTGKDNLVCVTCRIRKEPRSKHCRFWYFDLFYLL